LFCWTERLKDRRKEVIVPSLRLIVASAAAAQVTVTSQVAQRPSCYGMRGKLFLIRPYSRPYIYIGPCSFLRDGKRAFDSSSYFIIILYYVFLLPIVLYRYWLQKLRKASTEQQYTRNKHFTLYVFIAFTKNIIINLLL